MAPAEGEDRVIAVEVVYCPAPHVIDRVSLALPAGATAVDALRASGVLGRHAIPEAGLSLGLWGRACTPDQPLRERDRVEIYRPLLVDPKEARRQRYKGKAKRPPVG
jgi:hypothetical protein